LTAEPAEIAEEIFSPPVDYIVLRDV